MSSDRLPHDGRDFLAVRRLGELLHLLKGADDIHVGEFKVPYLPNMNVISALQQVQKFPKTADGKEVAPVVWEAVCLEEVCGACSMVINGRVRQACSTLVDVIAPNGEPITIEPMSK